MRESQTNRLNSNIGISPSELGQEVTIFDGTTLSKPFNSSEMITSKIKLYEEFGSSGDAALGTGSKGHLGTTRVLEGNYDRKLGVTSTSQSSTSEVINFLSKLNNAVTTVAAEHIFVTVFLAITIGFIGGNLLGNNHNQYKESVSNNNSQCQHDCYVNNQNKEDYSQQVSLPLPK